jgi:hypothetical protein
MIRGLRLMFPSLAATKPGIFPRMNGTHMKPFGVRRHSLPLENSWLWLPD